MGPFPSVEEVAKAWATACFLPNPFTPEEIAKMKRDDQGAGGEGDA